MTLAIAYLRKEFQDDVDDDQSTRNLTDGGSQTTVDETKYHVSDFQQRSGLHVASQIAEI